MGASQEDKDVRMSDVEETSSTSSTSTDEVKNKGQGTASTTTTSMGPYKSRYQNAFLKSVDKFFQITLRRTDFTTEILGGFVLYLTTVYIIGLNAYILSLSGNDMVSVMMSTAVLSGLGTITVSGITNTPVFLSTGMGENYFYVGASMYPDLNWQTVSGIVSIAGLLVMGLSYGFLKNKFFEAITPSIRSGIGIGIGVFIGVLGVNDFIPSLLGGVLYPDVELLVAVSVLLLLILVDGKHKWFWVPILGEVTMYLVTINNEKRKEAFEQSWNIQASFKDISVISTSEMQSWGWDAFKTLMTMILDQIFDSVCTVLTIIQFIYLDKIRFDNDKFLKLMKKSNKLQTILVLAGFWTFVSGIFGNSQVVPYIESIVVSAVGAKTGLSGIVTGILFLVTAAFPPLRVLMSGAVSGPFLLFTAVIVLAMIKQVDYDDLFKLVIIAAGTITIPASFSIYKGAALAYIFYYSLLVSKKEDRQKAKSMNRIVIFTLSVLAFLFLTRF